MRLKLSHLVDLVRMHRKDEAQSITAGGPGKNKWIPCISVINQYYLQNCWLKHTYIPRYNSIWKLIGALKFPVLSQISCNLKGIHYFTILKKKRWLNTRNTDMKLRNILIGHNRIDKLQGRVNKNGTSRFSLFLIYVLEDNYDLDSLDSLIII